ncbi:MAG: TRAP transporter small permease [Elusimicrobiota bacterium]
MEKLRAFESRLRSVEKGLLIALVCVLVSLSFVQVVLRSFFSMGLLWGDTFLRHMVLWVGFLGACVATVDNKQFSIDAAARAFRGRTKSAAHVFANLFTCAVCGLLARASLTFFQQERQAAAVLFSVGSLEVQTWVFELILPAGFLLLALHYALKIVLDLEDRP